jgi:magnesium transporter
MRDNEDFSEQLRGILAAEDQEGLSRLFDRQHPRDVAERLGECDDTTTWQIIHCLRTPQYRAVFSHLPMERQVRLMEAHADGDGAEFLQHLEADDRVALMQSLPNETRQRLLAQLDREARADIERLSIYRPGTAGSVMNTDVVTLPEELTVEAAIERLRAVAAVRETIYYNYVTDPHGKLLGIVSLRDLLLSSPETPLGDMMSTDVVAVWVDDDQEQVARKIREYDLIAIPVLHGDHRLAGVVTVDDAIDVSNDEATEDFHRIASVGHFTGSLRDASPWLLYQKRVPWLLALVFFNIFSGAGIAYFENTIAAYASLVFFLPLLIDFGGGRNQPHASGRPGRLRHRLSGRWGDPSRGAECAGPQYGGDALVFGGHRRPLWRRISFRGDHRNGGHPVCERLPSPPRRPTEPSQVHGRFRGKRPPSLAACLSRRG